MLENHRPERFAPFLGPVTGVWNPRRSFAGHRRRPFLFFVPTPTRRETSVVSIVYTRAHTPAQTTFNDGESAVRRSPSGIDNATYNSVSVNNESTEKKKQYEVKEERPCRRRRIIHAIYASTNVFRYLYMHLFLLLSVQTFSDDNTTIIYNNTTGEYLCTTLLCVGSNHVPRADG